MIPLPSTFPAPTDPGSDESADRWRFAVEASGLGVWDWNAQSGAVYYSPEWKAMLGYREADIGDGFEEWERRVHPEDLADARAQIDAHLLGHTPMYVSEHRLLCRDGAYKWILARGRVIDRDARGEPLRVVGTHTDITERKRTLSRLHEREARFSAVFNSTFQLMGVVEPDGRVIEGNETALNFAGLQPRDIAGRLLWELPYFQTSPETSALVQDAVHRAAAGELVRAEIEVLGAGDARMTVDFSLKPVRDALGRIMSLIAEGRDVSERKHIEQEVREREQHLRLTIAASPIGLALVGLDGSWLTVNDAVCEIVGYANDELMRMTFQDITHPDDLGPDLDLVQRTLAGEIPGYRLFKRYVHKDGSFVPIQLDVTLVRDTCGKPLHFVSHIQDISERRRFETLLQWEKERFKVALASITDAVLITDTAGTVDFANPIAERLLGLPPADLIGTALADAVDLRDDVGDPLELLQALPDRHASHTQGVAQLRRGSLPLLTLEYALAPLKDAQGEPIGFVFMLHDVTQARALTRALEHQATHDALTGLMNRSGFEQTLERQRLSSVRQPRPWCLLYLDLDRFKIVNDTIGHDAGDELLRALAVRLRAMLRSTDTFARLGGDEFGVILDECNEREAEQIAAKLIDAVDRFRFRRDKQQFQLGLSIGIAAPPTEVYTVADLLRMADAACYVAKRTGRNRACVYRDNGIDGVTPAVEFNAVNALQSAFDEQRLRVYAQKIVDLESGNAVGMELLTRLVGDDGSVIPPDRFLPVAERNDLITRLDSWMLRSAARLIGQNGGGLPRDWYVTVNVSGLSLSDLRFHGVISEVLSSSAELRDRICFEITESAAPSNWHVTLKGIELLRSHGSRVLLDDFGSGFTSFNYLRHLQVDGIKIAQDFTSSVSGDPINEPVVSMVAQLTRKLGIQAIAEGIEDASTARQLHARGIRLGQGFFFHRPQPVEDLLVPA
ncbi:bifunctional diguanylate cyclase/phosphodiesterase [Sinimarinibacterium flocculans]|uniref:PAS domain S-box-containing protein/diguanylate cyclase (GGDEF)-like protein n=1 Tax=Sinimarinibacterium flocculans TaxID=985250 RepID=A0A318EFG5_9GAMM|nr:PAS domain-containing protein [Sinimarinibacterium flocculans]PXV70414.1 PAS domain S-box-containing protein/diguanylate cyclase (GGDEF)-like protein [Sinimarinibacterium flocculans]